MEDFSHCNPYSHNPFSSKMNLLIKQEPMAMEEQQLHHHLLHTVKQEIPTPEIQHSPKKRKFDFSDPKFRNPPLYVHPLAQCPMDTSKVVSSKQFWKAGDYEVPHVDSSSSSGGLNHARVHPKFLHSNATSHKWALGAFAELVDNSVDEIGNGASLVKIDVVDNKKDWSKMVVVQDNGGGMNPCTMRHCMSLGYSAKTKMANTIGQYGNGFKTSTMRLGADVIVFSRCPGRDGKSPMQSIGMLSYTFLRSTGKDDIVVPILDYLRDEGLNCWSPIMESSTQNWNTNLDLILQWSPYSSEEELLQNFDHIGNQGTIVIIYNLWEDEQGMSELDFDTDSEDIQIRGVNQDATVDMAKNYPSSKHFLTYQFSLRSYASILYLRLPPTFQFILRGKKVEIHNIVDDMIHVRKSIYRPLGGPNLSAEVTMGFVKDAKDHIDVQGFNVYHKNRLIKPFWRVWNAAGSDGRGVIGVLEANFIEPAHDKQGFENTHVLQKLHARLMDIQKNYWREKCHEVGYAPRTRKTRIEAKEKENEMEREKEKVVENQSSSSTPTVAAVVAENNELKNKLPKMVEDQTRERNTVNFAMNKTDGYRALLAENIDLRSERNKMADQMHELEEKLKTMSEYQTKIEAEHQTKYAAVVAENRKLLDTLKRSREMVLAHVGDLRQKLNHRDRTIEQFKAKQKKIASLLSEGE